VSNPPIGNRPERRAARRPRRSNGAIGLAWLLVIALAAVIPYVIAQASHSSKTVTTTPQVSATHPTSSQSVIGASVAGTTTPTQSAAPTSTAPIASTEPPAPASAAPTTTPTVPAAPADPSATAPAGTYTVKPGDSLWRIAKAQGTGSNSAIAAKVSAIYTANRELIGPNPSVLRPGQVLTLA
jgi:nucleoid-associated protein YgaU